MADSKKLDDKQAEEALESVAEQDDDLDSIMEEL